MDLDNDLKNKIHRKLLQNFIIDDIKINIIDKVVTLKGTVDSYDVKDRIEEIVLSFLEVEGVNNELALYNEN
ncbi:BON domain-containing protein [Flavobacterium sp.]|uniref:BON domain-containing protein n=1 Tax=Flavobacterium sp. TaxID=239 RepID=UPI002FDE0ACB